MVCPLEEPEHNEAARKVKERKEREARLTEEKQDRYQNILNRFIAEGRATLRAFAFSNRTNFNVKKAASIYYGIMAVAHKMELSLGTKEGITSAVNGCVDQLTIWDGTKNHIINYWCPLKIFGDFRNFYFLGQPIYWTHK
ncbi:hypothetical protein [Prevotellamassilia timonensis]|uniref:hypothetical protein n=1 Tax=Prevotellamassilia timonensis TaxID=1852370 RepID=UPI001F3BAF53|nr:hypothetical protein [Prevotellamassilia timonensis]